MTHVINPWGERFRRLSKRHIIDKMTSTPDPYDLKGNESGERLAREFLKRYKQLFVPTDQLVGLVTRVVDIARAHSETTYTDVKSYIAGCYSNDNELPLDDFVASICIAGPAGVGKSSLKDAICRVLDGEIEIDVPNHGQVTAVTYWSSRMIPNLNPSSLTHAYLEADGFSVSQSTKGLLETVRHRAYGRGVCMALMDETQFNSMSSNANAQVAGTLIRLGEFGIPNVFFCNYSLGHKLLRRPQQDQHRILGRVWLILPDGEESDDWAKTVSAAEQLMPGAIDVDLSDIREQLHFWTAGIPRLLGELIGLALVEAADRGAQVTEHSLERVFKGLEYAGNRSDIELMYQQFKTNKQASRSRPDLWCPWPLEDSQLARLGSAAAKQAEREFLSKAADSMLTPEEKAISKGQDTASRKRKKASVTRIRDGRSRKSRLKDAAKEFTEPT